MVSVEEERLPKELVSDIVVMDYTTPLNKARQELKGKPAIIVNRNNEYYGILDSKALTGWKSLKIQEREKIGKIAIKAPKVSTSTSIGDMAYYFHKLRIKNLPYYYGGKIIGVVERSTLLKILLSLRVLEDVTVSETMSSPVLAIDSKASLAQAASTMVKGKVNRLVVLDKGRFVGLVTNKDIHKEYAKTNERAPEMKTKLYKPSNVSVDSIMEVNVKTAIPKATLAEAGRVMAENKVSSLVVTNGNNPIGIITVSDILEKIVANKRVEEKKVFISGFDEYTYQYEESVREEMKALMNQIEKMHELNPDYCTLSIKRIKLSSYEMQARVSLGKGGVIRVHSEGISFHEAFSELMKRLKNKVIKEKDNIVTSKRQYEHGVAYE